MQPLSPPPSDEAGANTFPRQLQRWLDDNPVTKLTRTQAYITLPAFSVNCLFNGYSDIVASFNFEGPNNFSLKAVTGIPANPNYCLCIMWIDVNRKVYRYSLWRGVGEVFYFICPLYEGQKIGKNFRFEIWSTLTFATTALILSGSANPDINGSYVWNGTFYIAQNGLYQVQFNATTLRWNLILISGPFALIAVSPVNNLFGQWLDIHGAAFALGQSINETLTQPTPVNFYTSVLGNVDYRYGSDFSLIGADAINTSFNSPNLNFPITFPVNSTPKINN